MKAKIITGNLVQKNLNTKQQCAMVEYNGNIRFIFSDGSSNDGMDKKKECERAEHFVPDEEPQYPIYDCEAYDSPGCRGKCGPYIVLGPALDNGLYPMLNNDKNIIYYKHYKKIKPLTKKDIIKRIQELKEVNLSDHEKLAEKLQNDIQKYGVTNE